MAKCAYESYALDQVWLIPAGHSPNKDEHGMTDAKDRFQMCKVSEQFPMHRFFFIMGGDSLDYFEQWKQPERIAKLATILVIPRDLFTIAALEKKIRLLQEQFPCDIRIVPCERFLMSSTKIRQALMRGEHPEHAFPEEVSAYIRRHHLYQS